MTPERCRQPHHSTNQPPNLPANSTSRSDRQQLPKPQFSPFVEAVVVSGLTYSNTYTDIRWVCFHSLSTNQLHSLLTSFSKAFFHVDSVRPLSWCNCPHTETATKWRPSRHGELAIHTDALLLLLLLLRRRTVGIPRVTSLRRLVRCLLLSLWWWLSQHEG